MSKFIPLHDWVLVTPFEVNSEEGGVVHAQSQMQLRSGEVISVGPGFPDTPMLVKEGDTVFFGAFSNHSLTFQDKKYILVHQSDVTGYNHN